MTEQENRKRVIFHADMDAFFTSVEQRDNPQYRGKPVIVGSEVGKRGVVSAASYEARRFGIHSAMPINEAFNRCPQGIFLTPRMSVYSETSERIMSIFSDFSPDIEQISVDEAFIDMSGSEKLFGTPLEAAKQIKKRIREEEHLTVSIGIAPNKFLAKIASDMNKPDGITLTPFDSKGIKEWLAPLNVQKLWGVGRRSAEILNSTGVSTVADLQALSLEYLSQRFGKQGSSLYYLCRGIDNREVGNTDEIKSISREHTFNVDSRNREEWKHALFLLCQDVAERARRRGVKGRTVVLTWRRPDFSRHSRRLPLQPPGNSSKAIYETVLVMLDRLNEPAVRLIGAGITGLDNEMQTDLFSDLNHYETWEKSEQVIDSIRDRFGSDIIAKGLEIGLKKRKKGPDHP